MLYCLFSYHTQNIGDEIQSLAAKQFLPKVDYYLSRDYLRESLLGLDKNDIKHIKLIHNGWFSHRPTQFFPTSNEDFRPLITSFHLSNTFGSSSEDMLSSKEFLNYLKNNEPIGCRDLMTKDLLSSCGVKCYFSGCLTLTFKNRSKDKASGLIVVSDVPKKVLPKIINQKKIKTKTVSHDFISWDLSLALNASIENVLARPCFRKLKEKKSEELLSLYSKAELVVTKRLHCALPCIAMGTKVILVHQNKNDPRFKGYEKFLKVIEPQTLSKVDSYDQLISLSSHKNEFSKKLSDDLETAVKQYLKDRA